MVPVINDPTHAGKWRDRSDEPRTFGFSAGVIGLAWPKDKNQRESNAESFLIDSGIREASN
jgi:hypothetical protein